MPRGRPSTYRETYCTEVVEILAQGHSITAFAGEIGIGRSTVFEWAKKYPDFADAIKIGQAKAVKYWENALKTIVETGKGNVTAAIFGLKNRAADDWNDKVVTEHTGKDGGPIATADISERETARRIAFLLAKGVKAPSPGDD